MNAFGSLFGIAIDPRDAQAMSDEMLKQRQIAQYAEIMQYKPTLAELGVLQNFRPVVQVPTGWADWYAHPDLT